MRTHLTALAIAALALSAPAATLANPAPPSTKLAPKCFYSHDWESWRPALDSKSIYVRVGVHDFYRIDFSDSCPAVQEPNAHLVTRPINDLICSPIELDVRVVSPPGIGEPCIVTGITPMSPADAAALPKKLKP